MHPPYGRKTPRQKPSVRDWYGTLCVHQLMEARRGRGILRWVCLCTCTCVGAEINSFLCTASKWINKNLLPVLLIRIRIRRIRMFLSLLDPDPLVGGMDPDQWRTQGGWTGCTCIPRASLPPAMCIPPPSPAWKAGYEKRWGIGQQEKNKSLFT